MSSEFIFNKEYELSELVNFVGEKIESNKVSLSTYVSTDNMKVDRGGVEPATKLPASKKFNHFRPSDTLFSNIRTYFRKVWLADFEGGASSDVLIFRTKNQNILKPEYLYYLLSDKKFVDYTVRTAKGAKMPRGDKSAIMQFKVYVPEPNMQESVVSSLIAFDHKLKTNTQTNQTLEQIAQTIFKSWFVDFDPVKAKIAAKAKLPSPSGRGARGEGKKIPPNLLENARKLRQTATDAEKLLWQLLRNRQIENSKFRRQHPIGTYILDFYCHECQLAIELDGSQHNEQQQRQYDEQRTVYLNEQGIDVLRFWNNEVFQNTESVLEVIYQALVEREEPSPLAPLPEGEGDEHPSVTLAAMAVISSLSLDELAELKQAKPEDYERLAQTAALFPSAMQDSDLGAVPEGWSVNKISDLGSVICGKTPSKAKPEFFGGDIPFIKIPDMHNSMFVVKASECLSQAGAESQPKKNIPRSSICVSSIATVGKVVITRKQSQTNQQINSILPHEDFYTPYLYFYMGQLEKHFHTLASGGSTTLNMNTSTFSKVNLLKPSKDILLRFSETTKEVISLIENNMLSNLALGGMLDTLLPKLLSGEIDLSATNEQTREASL